MRAYELYEADPRALGIYDPAQDILSIQELGDTRKPCITLRHINRLKHVRKARQKALETKRQFIAIIYGDPELTDRRAELEQESQRQQHELEMAKLELEKEKLAIQKEIEEAEIDQEAKDHIRDMAMNAARKRKK